MYKILKGDKVYEELVITKDRHYSYGFLIKFFGGEDNLAGITTPEIIVEMGDREVVIRFECDRVETDKDEYRTVEKDSYRIVEITSSPLIKR